MLPAETNSFCHGSVAGNAYFVLAVAFFKQDIYVFFPGRINGAANVVGLDGKLAVSAVNENQKLNGAGPAVIKDCLLYTSDAADE